MFEALINTDKKRGAGMDHHGGAVHRRRFGSGTLSTNQQSPGVCERESQAVRDEAPCCLTRTCVWADSRSDEDCSSLV